MRLVPANPPVLTLVIVASFGLTRPAQAQPSLPEHAVARLSRSQHHTTTNIRAAELSPDGKLLATLSPRSATVWDTATGEPRYRFHFDLRAPAGCHRGVAFSPDGTRLACGPSSDCVLVWDLATGKEVRRFEAAFERFSSSLLRFSADGSALILESGENVIWFDVETGTRRRALAGLRIAQFSRDDRTFVAVDEMKQEVLIGATDTGKIAHTLPIAAVRSDTEHGLVMLPDGLTLAAVHHFNDSAKEVQFWDLATGMRRGTSWPLPRSDGREPYRLSASRDGQVLYYLTPGNEVGRFALATGKQMVPLEFRRNYSRVTFVHPEGKTLVDLDAGEMRRWDLDSAQPTVIRKDNPRWREAAVAPDGRRVALRGDDGTLELWDTESLRAKRIAWPWNHGETLAFTADSRSLLVNEYTHFQFLDASKLEPTRKLTPEEKYSIGQAVLLPSPDGRLLATVAWTGVLRLIDLARERDAWALYDVRRAVFAPEGKKILVVTRDRKPLLRLVEVATRELIFEVERPVDRGGRFRRRRNEAQVSALAFSPTGRELAVAMTGGQICFLDPETGAERYRFLSMPTDDPVGTESESYSHATALAFSPDGRWLAVGGTDGFLRIWEMSTLREVHRLHGHEDAPQLLAFAANGRRLVSFGGGEGYIWDLRPTPTPRDPSPADPFAELLSEDGPTAYRALWKLGDDPATPGLLRDRLAVKLMDTCPERIAQLIAALGADSFEERDQAMRGLADLEGFARPALVAALADQPSLETKRRLATLLAHIDAQPETALRIARAVHALELSATPAARNLLREWSEGTPGLRLTEEARAALRRLR